MKIIDCEKRAFWGSNHTWEKWQLEYENDIQKRKIINPDSVRLTGKMFVQSRVCAVCGFKQYDQQIIELN